MLLRLRHPHLHAPTSPHKPPPPRTHTSTATPRMPVAAKRCSAAENHLEEAYRNTPSELTCRGRQAGRGQAGRRWADERVGGECAAVQSRPMRVLMLSGRVAWGLSPPCLPSLPSPPNKPSAAPTMVPVKPPSPYLVAASHTQARCCCPPGRLQTLLPRRPAPLPPWPQGCLPRHPEHLARHCHRAFRTAAARPSAAAWCRCGCWAAPACCRAADRACRPVVPLGRCWAAAGPLGR